jgi:hypothetical protein
VPAAACGRSDRSGSCEPARDDRARDAIGFAGETGPDIVDEKRTKHQTLGVLISETHGQPGDTERKDRNGAQPCRNTDDLSLKR